MTDRELMQQALEALEVLDRVVLGTRRAEETIAALRERLAQPEQEPVAWRWTESNGQHWFDWRTDWTHHDRAKAMGFAIEYAYTSPPASKPWVGLTDEEIIRRKADIKGTLDVQFIDFARAILAKAKEKNT